MFVLCIVPDSEMMEYSNNDSIVSHITKAKKMEN